MTFEFEPFPVPRRWLGPYSPRRGTNSGFTIRGGTLEIPLETDEGLEVLGVVDGPGVQLLVGTVTKSWGGGRILFLPNGLVIKPLPAEEDRGIRLAIGRFRGSLVLVDGDGTTLDLGDPDKVVPGEPWPGPRSIGLECTIGIHDGTIRSEWSTISDEGFLEEKIVVARGQRHLAQAFRKARRGVTGGRVRVSGFGAVITFRRVGWQWEPIYLGHLKGAPDGTWDNYLGEEWE